jgi:antitoxin (DNA-binding transcriptional repressor) of toxin-antitoxin stability system
MREMTVRELRDALSTIESLVEREREVVLTKHGRPLVKLVPLHGHASVPSHADLRAAMPLMTVPSEDLVREDRDRD